MRLRLLWSMPVAIAVIAVLVGGGVAALTTTISLKAGNNLVTCPAQAPVLSNTNVKAKSETVNCAKSTPTTTTTTVPVTTTTAPPTTTTMPASGTCTDPVYTTNDPEGTDNTDANGYWWVNNDAWNGGAGPQTLNVCSASSWNAVSTQPNDGGAVETYPDSEYDVGGRSAVMAGVNSTTPISGFSSIISTFSEAYPAAGGWDAAYDLWLNNWGTEIMIWNQWAGAQSYWPGIATITLTLDGVPYKFYDNGGELMFFRQTQVSSGSVDILAAFDWLVANGYIKSTDVPTQLEYGVEVCYTVGTETFPMTGLSFNLVG